MRHSLQVGFSFGLTSGIITTLGLMIGLYSSTVSSPNSKLVVIGGILTIAIADSLSDSLGIHISEESENKHTNREVWESTFATFFCKFVVACSFIIPVLICVDLRTAIIISVVWGFALLSIFSYKVAKECCKKIWNVVLEHLVIGIIVVIIAYYVGHYISIVFS